MNIFRKNVVTHPYVVSVMFVDRVEETEIKAESYETAISQAETIVEKYGGTLMHVKLKKEEAE
jgi:hypothetical protein